MENRGYRELNIKRTIAFRHIYATILGHYTNQQGFIKVVSIIGKFSKINPSIAKYILFVKYTYT
jgi:hypothetical protein